MTDFVNVNTSGDTSSTTSGDSPEYISEMVAKSAKTSVIVDGSPVSSTPGEADEDTAPPPSQEDTNEGETPPADETVKKEEEEEKKKDESSDADTEEEEDDTNEEDEKEKKSTQGLDFDKYNSEVAATGTISEDSYKELEEKGFPREMVDIYMEGLKARGRATAQSILDEVGGHEKFETLKAWVAQNSPKEEIIAFNTALEKGDAATMKLALRGFQAAYHKAHGKPPAKRVNAPGASQAASAGAPGIKPYGSIREMSADMRNPKYNSDESFRASVKARLAISNI